MSSGERPIGTAKGKQSDTEALCQPPNPPPSPPPPPQEDPCPGFGATVWGGSQWDQFQRPPPPPPPGRGHAYRHGRRDAQGSNIRTGMALGAPPIRRPFANRIRLGPQGCIRREGTSEAAPEALSQAVGGGCQSGWGAVTVGYKCH